MKYFFMTGCLVIIVGCATVTEKHISEDIAKQSEITNQQAVQAGREAIVMSKKLTEEQKDKMLKLMDDTHIRMSSIHRNESQTKASLFKYISSGEFDEAKIKVYRKKLIQFENEKLDIMFSNLKETRKILGKEALVEPGIPELLDFYQIRADLR